MRPWFVIEADMLLGGGPRRWFAMCWPHWSLPQAASDLSRLNEERIRSSEGAFFRYRIKVVFR